MQRKPCTTLAGVVVALVAAVVCLAEAAAQTPRGAPTRVNAQSIRTTAGQPLLRSFRMGESAEDYEGGFLHLYPGRNAIRRHEEQNYTAQAQFVPGQNPRRDLLPPLPSDDGEPVMGIQDPVVDEPVYVDSPLSLEGLPTDSFEASDCDSCKTGKCYGKGHGKGYGAFHDWNWACFCVPLPPFDNLSVNAGAHGFKNQLSQGFDDSFGFHEGFNLGAGFGLGHLGLGWQLGLQGTHSNFSGAGDNIIDEDFVDAPDGGREQLFFTWGFFRRVDCGLQGGFVFDYLHDDWYYDEISISQLRGEFSWMHSCHHECGIFFHTNLKHDEEEFDGFIDEELNVRSADLVALFYRHHFDDCGYSYLRTYIGLTGNRSFYDSETEESSTILGGDIHLGMSEHWALETGFTYVTAADADDASQQEDWNVAFNIIWYPFGQKANTLRRYYRPLFNVADNGTMLIDADD